MNRKVCVISGSRAEYGILKLTMERINSDPDLMLQVLVTGSHLSTEFGSTFQQIESDGFVIDRKCEMLLSSDTASGVLKSMGICLIGLADAISELSPDLILLVGDRSEIFAAATAATVLHIPIAHIHGGEITLGAIDDVFRHSITKMAHLHFTSTAKYRERVIQMGEDPRRVFVVGAPSLEYLEQIDLLPKEIVEERIGLAFNKKTLFIAYHPETQCPGLNRDRLEVLFDVLDSHHDVNLIFTKSNGDEEGRLLTSLIERYVQRNRHRAVLHASLGQPMFFSTLKLTNGIVGNSSSGIIEAPSLGVGTVNIGCRQAGRVRGVTIIDCESTQQSLSDALAVLFGKKFKGTLKLANNPYYRECPSRKIIEQLKNDSFLNILRKEFIDGPINKEKP
jgi:UDP-hydrolysing UDP-N-acetyl-D-glucosamine 2-epimerase